MFFLPGVPSAWFVLVLLQLERLKKRSPHYLEPCCLQAGRASVDMHERPPGAILDEARTV